MFNQLDLPVDGDIVAIIHTNKGDISIRLFPEKAKIQMPLYVSYSNETTSPDYDPLDTDVKLKETLEREGMLSDKKDNKVEYFVSDQPIKFANVANIFIGHDIEAKMIDIEKV